jgi:hypothetical protein
VHETVSNVSLVDARAEVYVDECTPKFCEWTISFRHVVRKASILFSTAKGDTLAETTVKQNPSTPQVRRTDAFTLRVMEHQQRVRPNTRPGPSIKEKQDRSIPVAKLFFCA